MIPPHVPTRLAELVLVASDATCSAEFYSWLLAPDAADEGAAAAVLRHHGIRGVREPEPGALPPAWVPVFTVADVGVAVRRAGDLIVAVGDGDGDLAYVRDAVGVHTALRTASDAEPGVGRTTCDYTSADPAAAAASYATLFGARAVAYPGDAHAFHALMDGDVEVAGVVEFGGQGLRPGWVHYFDVPDVDARVSRAIAAGARLRVPAGDTVTNRYTVLEDPFGQLFGLSTRFDGIDPRRGPALGLPEIVAD